MKRVFASIAILVVLAGIFFVSKKAREAGTTTSPTQENGATEVVGTKPSDGKVKGADPFLQGAAAEPIPWQKTALKKVPNGAKLNIVVEVRKWCAMGDMDVIRLDDRASENKNLILSVEPLVAKDESMAPLQTTIRLQDLDKGFKTTFNIPAFGQPKQLGLFLCRSSRDKARCSEEPPVDYSFVMTEHMKNPNRNPAAEPSRDRLYFFQYLFLETSDALLSFQNPNITDTAFENLSQYMDKLGSQADRGNEKEALAQAKSFTQALKSMPLEYDGELVRMVLPVLDTNRANCPDPAQAQ